MQQLLKKILLSIGIFLLLPIGITAGISDGVIWMRNYDMDLEKILPILLCQQIDWNYDDETIKAQAVLARSSLSLCIKKKELTSEVWRNWMADYQNQQDLAGYKKAYEKMERAAKETKGQVLVQKDEEICEGVFHKVSSGYTREGAEVLKNTIYQYLSKVKSRDDISAKDYLQGHYFSEEALKMRITACYPGVIFSENSLVEQIQTVHRDSSDYVVQIKIGDVEMSGEEFRINMELSSANFTIQEVDGKIRFLCKGLGHGLGMSQFGANVMAKEGFTYLEILKYYFPQVQVKKI